MEYASRAVGNAGLTTGVIGTALGVLNGAGGIGELIGAGTRPRGPQNEGDIPVTRHDMGLYRELSEKDFKIASLEANKYTDQQIRELSEKMNAKIDAFAAQTGMRFDGIQQQLVIPNRSVMPGWGPVEIAAPGGTVATSTTGTNG